MDGIYNSWGSLASWLSFPFHRHYLLGGLEFPLFRSRPPSLAVLCVSKLLAVRSSLLKRCWVDSGLSIIPSLDSIPKPLEGGGTARNDLMPADGMTAASTATSFLFLLLWEPVGGAL